MKLKHSISKASSLEFLVAVILVVLAVLSFFSGSIGLVYALVFTLFLPGFVFVNLFFKDLESVEKLALTLFLSVLFSTHLVYWLSLVFGYSKFSVVLAGLLFVPPLFFLRLERPDPRLLRHPAVLLATGVFLVFYVVLSGSVWVLKDDVILLSGSNWQDTPMHLGIIESLNQGNFPPEMPYYSGLPMTYHYFVDFHTAIIEKMWGVFNPRLLVYLNSFFASLFALTLYLLASHLLGGRAATFAVILGVFGGGFSYIRFFEALSQGGRFSSDLFLQNYTQEWKGFFQIVPTFEVLLQSRPQMMGLPGLALAAYLLYQGLNEQDKRKLILSGLITGLIFPFQVTSTIALGIIFTLLTLKKQPGRISLFFLLPTLVALPFLLAINPSASRFSLNPGWWAPDKTPLGLVIFYTGNLGLPFLISFLLPLFQRRHLFFIYSWLTTMFLIPNIVSFTPESFDMYKFFHFMWIPVAIASGGVLNRLYSKKKVLALIVIAFSVFTPLLDAAWNLSVEYPGYTLEEYSAGIWIRENTPQQAVFLEEGNIHSPPTQIAGRLRIQGYGTWPYGHGYDIWTRDRDIKKAFQNIPRGTLETAEKYNATYAYIGREELQKYPGVKEKFDQHFKRVYSNDLGRIWIYRLK